MAMVPVTVLVLVLMVAPAGWCQANNNQPVQPGTYYLDSNADCNGPVREIYGQTVRVIGHGTIQEQQSPQSCTLQLRSSSALEQTQLRIQVVAATIRDCDVRLTIFDGDPGQNTLRGYDCNTPSKPNERDFITTGDLVSFTLTRRDSVNTLFDIEFFVSPLVLAVTPVPEAAELTAATATPTTPASDSAEAEIAILKSKLKVARSKISSLKRKLRGICLKKTE